MVGVCVLEQQMRQHSYSEGVVLSNRTTDEGNYVPLKVRINFWVNLILGRRGDDAKDTSKHGHGSNVGIYKAKVFEISCQ